VLTDYGTPIAPSTYYEHRARVMDAALTDAEWRDALLCNDIYRVWTENYQVYGARKVWLQLNREGIAVARCTVERLMRQLGLEGARRGGKKRRTTVSDPNVPRPADLVKRQFTPDRPDRLWVADFTYCPTWSGTVYVAFVLDAFSRRILGWRAATNMRTSLVLDALEMALWARERQGVHDLSGLTAHNDAGSQYLSLAYTERLAMVGVAASVGSVGDAYDNALAESQIGLFKTELIHPGGPWKGLDDVELATLEWVDWHNHRRLHTACHDLTPAEYEQVYHGTHPAQATLEESTA
jgi:putative transposase